MDKTIGPSVDELISQLTSGNHDNIARFGYEPLYAIMGDGHGMDAFLSPDVLMKLSDADFSKLQDSVNKIFDQNLPSDLQNFQNNGPLDQQWVSKDDLAAYINGELPRNQLPEGFEQSMGIVAMQEFLATNSWGDPAVVASSEVVSFIETRVDTAGATITQTLDSVGQQREVLNGLAQAIAAGGPEVLQQLNIAPAAGGSSFIDGLDGNGKQFLRDTTEELIDANTFMDDGQKTDLKNMLDSNIGVPTDHASLDVGRETQFAANFDMANPAA